MYLVIFVDDTYCNEAQTKEQIKNIFKSEGEVTFRKSRKHRNYEFVTVNGHTVARAFYTQAAQIKYLKQIGVLKV